jgi:photosystem II stability/assembly factor-like uncharacterized protein
VPRAAKFLTAGPTARRLFIGAALVAFATAASAAPEQSEPSRLAAKSLLLDIARAGETLVAVGDRGHVVLSTDEGATWTQAVTPTRAMLTAVAFPDATHGWAVGHDGVILHTSDGGRSWARQDKGDDLETVLLDVHFLDPKVGFAVGAYGKFLATTDGGATWEPRRILDEDLHLNRLSAGADGHLYLAGEAGTVLASTDRGATWRRTGPDYEGSLFGIRPLAGGLLVAYGLRGHIFVSPDDGATWQTRETDVKVLLMACAKVRDGELVVAGQGGNFYLSRDSAKSFQHWKPADFGGGVADLVVARDGHLVTVGEAGAVRLRLP